MKNGIPRTNPWLIVAGFFSISFTAIFAGKLSPAYIPYITITWSVLGLWGWILQRVTYNFSANRRVTEQLVFMYIVRGNDKSYYPGQFLPFLRYSKEYSISVVSEW